MIVFILTKCDLNNEVNVHYKSLETNLISRTKQYNIIFKS